MIRALLSLVLVATATGQNAADLCASALLRGDQEAAAAAAASAKDPALRARLQAALLPPSRRPAAMLSVAIRYPDSIEADHALLAGAAAILVLRDGKPLPGLVSWNELEDPNDGFDDYLPGAMIEAIWRQVERRRKNGGDLAMLGEAENLLHRCSVSRYGFEPVRVLPTAEWQLPQRRESMQFRAWRRQPGVGSWSEITPAARPDRTVSLPVGRKEPLSALPSGDWFVELASTRTRYRGFRLVEVSDVDVITMCDGERLALAAWQNTKPIENAEWWFREHRQTKGRGVASGTIAGATGVLSCRELWTGGELFLTSNEERARVAFGRPRHSYSSAARWQVHMMVDRPIHRPGEKVMGRFVLRETQCDGHGLDAVLNSGAAAGQAYELRVFEGDEEVRLVGRTDAHGVGSFEVPVPAPAKHGAVAMRLFLRGEDEPIYKGLPCSVASFRRPAMFVEVVGPSEAGGKEQASVAAHATWASGAPAANLPVTAKLRVWTKNRGVFSDEHKLQTGATGLATLEIPVRKLEATWVRVDFTVATPSGPKKLMHTIGVRDDDAKPSGRRSSWRAQAPQLSLPEVVVAGRTYEIGVHGKPREQVILIVGRGGRMRVHALDLNDDGKTTFQVEARRDEWPALDVAIASAKGWDSERVPMLLNERMTPTITVARQAAPGAEVACHVATGQPGAVVTVGVVDERVFRIEADRTLDPEKALRPRVARARWRLSASAAAMAPKDVLGSLLEDGRIPTSEFSGSIDGSPGGPAAGGPAMPAPSDVRRQFRATATFVTGITGEDGAVSVPIKLPDDLTTWRVTVVGVAADGGAFLDRRELVTEVPLAAEPVLPRVLRVGDAVEVAVAVDRKAGTVGGAAVRLTAACKEQAASIDRSEFELAVAEGMAASAKVTVNGVASGVSQLALSASVGKHQDHSVRPLRVHPDAVLRPVARAGMGIGKVTVKAPEGIAPDGTIDVRVLGGSSAAWAEIDRRLQTYPYGCVEQTLAKLLPYFAAVRGAKAHGAEPPVADDDFTKRLRAGMRRMRRLQKGRGGAFAFWPGGDADLGMTVLVLHGLSVLREGGHDPERFGLLCDPTREPFASAIAQVSQRSGAATKESELLEIELAAACLRLRPKATEARRAVLAAVKNEQQLPRGLLLRAGLALAAAGEPKAAVLCLRRGSKLQTEGAPSGLPGEDALAASALQLELQWTLEPRGDHADLASEVLIGCLDGYSTTYAQACALSALALALPRIGSTDFPVSVRAGGKEKMLSLDPENGFSARVTLPYAEACSVVGPDAQQLIVQVAGQRREAGSKNDGWQSALTIERALCRRIKGWDEDRRRSFRFVPIARGDLHVGEPVWLRVRMRASRPERYVVVDCPLPAGFEPIEEMSWIERFDDRIAMCCSFVGRRDKEFLVPLVPTMVGTMAWPPTTAAPMYANGRDAGTAGSTVTVGRARADGNLPTKVFCDREFPTPKPSLPKPATAEDRLNDAMYDLRDMFDGDDYVDLPDKVYGEALLEQVGLATQAIDARGRTVAALLHVVEELTDTIEAGRFDLDGAPPGAKRTQARAAVLMQLIEKLHVCVLDTLVRMGDASADEWDRHDVNTIVSAVVMWPDRYQREACLAEILQLAVDRDELSDYVLDDIVGPVETEELRSVLLTMLATHSLEQGAALLRLLPRDELAGVAPEVLLVAAHDEWPEWLAPTLLKTPTGRAELRRMIVNPESVAEHGEELLRVVPHSYWRTAPLTVFAEISDTDVEGVEPVDVLAASDLSNGQLQQELRHTADVDWQAMLIRALLIRGVRDVGPATVDEDAIVGYWRDALLLDAADTAGVLRLHQRTVDEVGTEPLCLFLRDRILRAGTVQQLAAIVEHLEEEEVAKMLARLGRIERRAMLDLVAEPLAPLPSAHEQADCLALWRYGKRTDDQWEVLAALCRTEVGLRFATRTVAAVGNEELREELQEDLWTLQGLDAQTGEAPVDESWLPLLTAVKHRGVPTTWTVLQRRQYDRLRLLRGVR